MAGLDFPITVADSIRREAWRLTAKTGIGRAAIHDRPTRLALLAVMSMAVALTITAVAPLWMLLLGPILLGVPHVAGDVRYLILRPPVALRRAFVCCLLFPLAALVGLRTWVIFDGPYLSLQEIAMGCGAVALAITLAPGSWTRRLLVAGAITPVAYLALTHPKLAGLTLAHLHNFVALSIWLWFAHRAMPSFKHLSVGLFFLACVGLIMFGAFDDITARFAGFAAPVEYFSSDGWVKALAPGLPEKLALRLVQVYIFSQAMHYTVWLRLMPQQMHDSPTPSTFRDDLKGLRNDFGLFGLLALIAAALAVPVYGCYDAAMANWTYLTIVLFHGWLELAFIAYLAVSGTRLARP